MNIDLNSVKVRVAVVVAVALVWFLYRMYKRFIIRKGKKRLSKILLLSKEKISLRSPITGKLRWVIQPAIKLTFTDSNDRFGLELVKFDTDPITVLHAFKEKLVSPDQYHLEGLRFVRATEEKLGQIIKSLNEQGKLDAQASDTLLPSLRDLFKSFLE